MKDFTGKRVNAYYYRGLEAVGGVLSFEENKMIFSSHAFNMQTGDTEIIYEDILSIDKKKAFFVLPIALEILTCDGILHKMIITGRDSVVEYLSSRAPKLKPRADVVEADLTKLKRPVKRNTDDAGKNEPKGE